MGFFVALWGGLLLIYAFGEDSKIEPRLQPYAIIVGALFVLGGLLAEKFGKNDD